MPTRSKVVKMASPRTEDKEKVKRDRAKRAVALAIQSRWSDAVETNLAILADFPGDLEAYNRLGKSLTELGRISEAKEAFRRALEISPHNAIAQKNVDRLTRLGDEGPSSSVKSGLSLHAFIEESGKAAVTSLVGLTSSKVLLKMSPGRTVLLNEAVHGLTVEDHDREYLGLIEPRLASRLIKLIRGGNRYEATVTSVGEQELTVIVREVYKHPSQAGTVSFPSRGAGPERVDLQGASLDSTLGEEEGEETEAVVVKDWSNDDTEPGDDDAFSPVIHRIINTEKGEGGRTEDV